MLQQNVSERRLVPLRGGAVVPEESLVFALQLEARGCTLKRDGDDGLLVAPREVLDEHDRAEIRRLKPDLLALVSYVDDERWRM